MADINGFAPSEDSRKHINSWWVICIKYVDRSEAWFRSLDAMRCSFLRNWLSDRAAILGESLIVNYFVSFYRSESVSLKVHGSVRPTPSTFHVTFIKIINVDKNNKRVY